VRLLLDSSVWGPTGATLRAHGHDVEWVGDWPSDPGDLAILQHANADRRILVTLDNDFGELAVRQGVDHSGIIRLVLTLVSMEAEVCLAALAAFGAELLDGAIMTATPRRMRVRPAYRPDDA
jgi:predicted nuclease of predicted toxin-antitoxin system